MVRASPEAWWDLALAALGGPERVSDCCFGPPRRVGDATIVPVVTLEAGGATAGGSGFSQGLTAFGARVTPAAVLVVRGEDVRAVVLDPRARVAGTNLPDTAGPPGREPSPG